MTKGIDKYSIDSTDYTVGQDNVQKWGFDVHNPVFGISAGAIIIFLIALLVADPETAKAALDGIKWKVIGNFDGFFMWAANLFVIFCFALIVSPYGKIRIGGNDAKAEHSNLSWMSMLFAAGMGIGLMFWGVAEPVAYFTGWYQTPLGVEAYSPEAAKLALGATIYNWGLHGWSIYAVVALALAFFTFNKGLPLSIRSIFYPILGDRTWGWFGHMVDIVAVLATLFGLAAGWFFERVIVKPVYSDHLRQILISIGALIVAEQIILAVWGGSPMPVPRPALLEGSFVIGDVAIETYRVFAFFLGLAVFIALSLVLNRTRIGLLIRAGVENREMVEALGFRIDRLFIAVFMVGSALAAMGGAMWAGYQGLISGTLGSELMILVFIVVIIGGLGSIEGSLLGALLVGLLGNYIAFIFPKLSLASNMILMMAILLWRPLGLRPAVGK